MFQLTNIAMHYQIYTIVCRGLIRGWELGKLTSYEGDLAPPPNTHTGFEHLEEGKKKKEVQFKTFCHPGENSNQTTKYGML